MWELVKNGVMLFGVGELGMVNMILVVVIVSIIIGWDFEEVVGIGVNLLIDKLVNKIDVVCWVIMLN